MNTEDKAKWIEALRSGKYIQGTGRLSYDGKHCCLGVLCDVLGISNNGMDCLDEKGEEVGYTPFYYMKLPAGDLVAKNDRGDSFEDIAAYIEANL